MFCCQHGCNKQGGNAGVMGGLEVSFPTNVCLLICETICFCVGGGLHKGKSRRRSTRSSPASINHPHMLWRLHSALLSLLFTGVLFDLSDHLQGTCQTYSLASTICYFKSNLRASVSCEATRRSTCLLRDCFPYSENTGLTTGGGAMKELWSGRSGGADADSFLPLI